MGPKHPRAAFGALHLSLHSTEVQDSRDDLHTFGCSRRIPRAGLERGTLPSQGPRGAHLGWSLLPVSHAYAFPLYRNRTKASDNSRLHHKSDFICGVISVRTLPWRLVATRGGNLRRPLARRSRLASSRSVSAIVGGRRRSVLLSRPGGSGACRSTSTGRPGRQTTLSLPQLTGAGTTHPTIADASCWRAQGKPRLSPQSSPC